MQHPLPIPSLNPLASSLFVLPPLPPSRVSINLRILN
jgi:hypothetical protein